MKKFLLLLWVCLLTLGLYAQNGTRNSVQNNSSENSTHVTAAQALEIGYTFMHTGNQVRGNGTASVNVNKQTMQLVYTGIATDSLTRAVTDCYYVFSLQPTGFVIVSADERAEPILGYSYDNNFVVEGMPDNMRYWLDHYVKQIYAAVSNGCESSPEITEKWTLLRSGQPMPTRSITAVSPLIQTTWSQGTYYNQMCPADANGPNGHVLTGCVATAMAQIIRYWQWPNQGINSHSYVSNYGTLSVDFNSATYNYNNMPNALSSSSSSSQVNEVAKLMYHCGVAVDMEYYAGSSGASIGIVPNALYNYFAYANNGTYVARSNYSDNDWANLIKQELNNSRPVLYAGYNSSTGHAFVCDGYDYNGAFHFNWGWGGSCNDAYYTLDALTPCNNNYSYDQEAVIGISATGTFLRCSTSEMLFAAAIGEESEVQTLSVRGHSLSGSINVTVGSGFQVSTNGTSYSTSATLSSTGGTLYLKYIPTSSNSVNYTMNLTSGTCSANVTLHGSVATEVCVAPKNLTGTHTGTAVNLSWNEPVTYSSGSPASAVLSWASGSDVSWYGLDVVSPYCIVHRFEPSDLTLYNQYLLKEISFIASPYAESYRVVVFKGGNHDNGVFHSGEQVVNQVVPISTVSSNGWKTVTLTNPVLVDATSELWFGIIVKGSYVIPSVSGTIESYKSNVIASMNSENDTEFIFSTYFSQSPLKGTVEKISGQVSRYDVYRQSTLIGNTTNLTYTDSNPLMVDCQYMVAAVWSSGCSEESVVTVTAPVIAKPTVTTNNVSNIAATTATCGGNVTSDGGATVYARGVCWSTSPNPTVSDNHTSNGTGMGAFTSSLTGLTPHTNYYVRAYATNTAGTNYGQQQMFMTSCNPVTVNISGTTTINYGGSTTLTASGANSYSWSTGSSSASITVSPTTTTTYAVTGTNSYGCTGTASVTVTVNNLLPTVTTNTVSNIAQTTATCGGNVTSDGGTTVYARGVCWSTSPNPTVNDNHTSNGTGTSEFTSSLTGLTPHTTYYVRAYATNTAGTNYGQQQMFMTSCNTVTVNISGTTTINYGGNTTLTASGANSYNWSTGSSNASITVSPTTTTTYAVTGTNSYGCTGTANVTVTVNYKPTVTTNNVTNIAQTTATCGGNVTSDGGATVTARGVCWSTSPNPTVSGNHTTNGTGTGAFTSTLIGLSPSTVYYVRAYATNSTGTNYGEQKIFTTATENIPPTTPSNPNPSNGATDVSVNPILSWSSSDPEGDNVGYDFYLGTSSSYLQYQGNGVGTSISLSGLSYNQTYYWKVVMYDNQNGCTHGPVWQFTTSCNTVNVSIAGTTTISYGGSTTLTASGANTYSWNTGNSNANITVSPSATTSYTVTGTNSYGCTGTASVTVTVNYNKPTVTTSSVSNITATTAKCGGEVTADGGATITARGVCWSTSQNPTVSGSHTTNGSGTGSFTSSITGLTPNTKYYVRAYATNSAGTSYGAQKTFTTSCNTVNVSIAGTTTINYGDNTTLTASGANSYSWSTGSNSANITVSPTATTTYTVTGTNQYGCTGTASVTVTVNYLNPTVTTNSVTNIAATTASCGGNVTADGGTTVTARGVCWSTSQNPTVSGSHTTNSSGTGSFTSSITGLTPNTTYYVRAYATNSIGTAYGNEIIFTTSNCSDIYLPFVEDFESYTASTTASTGVQPNCWELVREDVAMTEANRPQLYYKNSYAHSGSYSLLLNYRGIYAMPALSENMPMNNVKLEMYLRQPKAAYQLEVGVYEDDGTFVPVTTFNNSGTGVELVECDFSAYTGNGHRIAFRNILGDGANYNYSYNYIDDIVLTSICDPIPFPYTETFESYTASTTASTGVQPDCWSLVREDVAMTEANRPQLYYKSSFAHSGKYSLLLNYRGVYAMPALSEDVPINNVKLEMYLRQPKATYQLEVGVYEYDGTFVPVATFNNSGTGVEFVTCDFSSYTGNGRRIAFHNVLGGGANYNYSYNYLDDIVLTYLCEPIVPPYSEDFESYTASTTVSTGVQPDCWELVQADVAMTDATQPQLYYKSSFAHSGNYSLKMGYRGIYAMPALSGEVPMNNVKLEMYLRQPNAAYQLEVGVWDGQAFVPVRRINNSTTEVEHVVCDFSTYTGNGHRIAFRNVLGGGANYSYSYNYIDDIVLTVCNPISLPYAEDFESLTESTTASTGVEPDCWDLVREDVAMTDATRPQLYYKSSYAHSGNYSLKMGYRGIYAMPALSEEVPMNNVRLEMYLRQPNAAYRLEVGVWDDMTQTFEVVKLFNNSTTNVEHVTCDFSSYNGSGRRIAFRNVLGGGANYNYSYNYIDDIILTEMEDCTITLPYSENFDSYTTSTTAATGVKPECWELVQEDVSMTDAKRPQIYYKSDYAHSGSYSLMMAYRGIYAMPALSSGIPMNQVSLKMYLRQSNAAYRLQVGVWEDDGTFVPVALFNNSGTGVQYVECDFSGYNGNGRRIAFRNVLGGGANYAYSYNYLDDITLSYTDNARNAANENNFNGTGIGRLLESVTVYPNPTKDYVNVQCTMNDVHCSGIEVIDMYGKVIYTVVETMCTSSLPTRINVSNLAAGMYFVRVTTDQGTVTKTFVKR